MACAYYCEAGKLAVAGSDVLGLEAVAVDWWSWTGLSGWLVCVIVCYVSGVSG